MNLDEKQFLADLDTIGQIGADADGSVNRIAYSPADQEARHWVENTMQKVGMTVRRDAVGNSIGTYPGQNSELPPMVLGSHTDTVPNGGRFDGALGIVAGLACVRALFTAQQQLQHPLELINFAAEEATVSSGTLGSRAMAGLLEADFIEQQAWDDQPLKSHLQAAGLDPTQITQAQRPPESLAAYLELHIEQGNNLDMAQIPIGIVEGIVGIRRYTITLEGEANHAGTTPMLARRDALIMASSLILALRQIVSSYGIVGTIGTLQVEPNVPNIIPGRATLGAEIRGLKKKDLDKAEHELKVHTRQAGGTIQRISAKPPVTSDSHLLEMIETVCADLELPALRLPSGAGHDAMNMASLGPQAMIFVPSRGGISHTSAEFTDPEHCVKGANVLLKTLLHIDGSER